MPSHPLLTWARRLNNWFNVPQSWPCTSRKRPFACLSFDPEGSRIQLNDHFSINNEAIATEQSPGTRGMIDEHDLSSDSAQKHSPFRGEHRNTSSWQIAKFMQGLKDRFGVFLDTKPPLTVS